MMQRMKGTLRPGRKAGVLALAVLLLTCVLMAGAVSASDGVHVSDYNDLVTKLSDTSVKKIILDDDIDAGEIIKINRDVIIDGQYHTISAKPEWSQAKDQKNLLLIENGTNDAPAVTLENIFFEGCGSATADAKGAHGIQVYNTGTTTQMQLKNITINGSQGSGLNVNGGNVSLINVTIQNSEWQSVDVSANVESAFSSFTMDSQSRLLDAVEINTDQPGKEVELNLPSRYLNYSFSYYSSDGTYDVMKRVWSTDVDAAAKKIAESKGVTFNATVQNPNDPLAYHADFSEAMSDAKDGATVTQLEELILTEPITIDDAITFDGKNKEIIGESGTGYFLMVAVPLDGNGGKQVTLQNLNLNISRIGSSADLGGITVRAPSKVPSVPVTLKDSIVDMGDVDMIGGSMNPAVYFVNASGSKITGNTITAGSTDSSSTRCVVVDGGSDVTISSGNTLNLGTAKGGAASIGVQIKGPNPNDVTVTGNTITAPNDPDTKSIAVDITTTGKGESHSITGNIISAAEGSGKFDSAVRVLLSSEIPDEGGSLGITVSGNTVTDAAKGVYIMAGSPGAQEKQLKLTGTINVDDFQELSQDAILAADPELPKPDTDSVEWTHDPEPSYSSGGNMNNAYRVLFNDGSTTLSVQTDLSSGDKLTKPETPVKDGYTFAGWYKDSACTQAWDFETGISGDMTLYAKWTAAGSSGETEATATPTKTATAVTTPQPTKTQTAAATTSAPEATTAAGVSPTLTQAPAPVAGALFGLLAAGVLLRRRFQ